jgi:hypothetical protein
MSTAVKIPGSLLAFERDIHQLIDDYATLAAPEGTWDPETGLQLLFSTFKELWKARGMTFIHKVGQAACQAQQPLAAYLQH